MFPKSYFRNFRANLSSNLISLAGLSVGMMVTVFSLTYIIFESSYDRFHSDSDRLYQVSTRMQLQPGNEVVMSSTHQQLKDYIHNHIPGIESTCRLRKSSESIYIGEQRFRNHNGLFIDKDFFSVFSYKMLSGDGAGIAEPNTIILGRSLAEKFYGTIDCLGKTLIIKDEEYSIIGIVEDPPGNSTIQFEYLVPLTNFFRTLPETFNFLSVETYFKAIHPIEDYSKIQILINAFYNDYDIKSKEMFSVELMKLTELHQYFDKTSRNYALFITISLLVLFVSIVNYINAFAAQNEKRIREIGIRKVYGASRASLIGSILLKSIIITILAALLGSVLSELFMDTFRNLSGINVKQYGAGLWWIQVSLLLIAIITGFAAGIFPALRYSSLNPISMMRGSGSILNGTVNIRKVLVVIQYIISAGLLISIFIFFSQIRYLGTKDPGFNTENRMLIEVSPALEFKYNTFIEELKKIPGVITISANGPSFGQTAGMSLRDRDTGEGIPALCCFVEDNFFEAYGIDLLEGKTFSQTTGVDTANVIIDRASVEILGLDDPIGKKLYTSTLKELEIIGVVENADLIAKKGGKKPFLFTQFYNISSELIIHYNGEPSEIARNVADRMVKLDPEFEFNYRYLSEARKSLYAEETNQTRILLFVGIVAVILSLVGSYSMVSFLAERRAKQISIRKVMGASVADILQLSAWQGLSLIIIAFVIASPVAYIIGNQWLQNFVMKAPVGPLSFLVAFALLTTMVFLTVYFKEKQAAMANPAETLRQE